MEKSKNKSCRYLCVIVWLINKCMTLLQDVSIFMTRSSTQKHNAALERTFFFRYERPFGDILTQHKADSDRFRENETISIFDNMLHK